MKPSRNLVLPFVLVLSACTSVKVIPDESNPDDPPDCEPVDVAPTVHVIDGVKSASLFGTVLHVDGSLDGRAAYVLIDLSDELGVAGGPNGNRLVDVRPDLIGQARWAHIQDATYFRVLGTQLQVAENGASFSIVSSAPLPGTIPEGFTGALGVADSRIHLCLTSTNDADARVVAFESDSLDQYAPRESLYCNGTWYGSRGAAAGSFWVTFGPGDPPKGSDVVTMWDLGNVEDPSIESHGYSVDGVHHYGYIRELETDDKVAVANLDNQSYVFLYYREGPSHVVYSTFGSGEKKLLAVIDQVVYVARENGPTVQISAYDVHDGANVEQLDMRVSLEGATGGIASIAAVAHDAERLVLTDERGAAYVVPLQNSPASVGSLRAASANLPIDCPH